MDSEKARQVRKILIKLMVKKGGKDLMRYGLPVLLGMLPVLGDTTDVVDVVQELIGLFSDKA